MRIVSDREVAAFLTRFSVVAYDPDNFQYRVRRYYDTQDVASAASATTVTEFFNTSTSTKAAHARGLYGCNLPNIGRLPGNTTFIVARPEFKPLVVATAAKVNDCQLFSEFGLCRGIFVQGDPQVEEFAVAPFLAREGVQPINIDSHGTDAGTAATVHGACGIDQPETWTPESYPVIGKDQAFYAPVGFNGNSNLSAALSVQMRLVGLEIQNR